LVCGGGLVDQFVFGDEHSFHDGCSLGMQPL
jgi:hypothetical protein